MDSVPSSVAAVVGDVLGGHYFNHKRINLLFLEAGAGEDVPEGSCADKISSWLKRPATPGQMSGLPLLGKILEEYMDADLPRWSGSDLEKGQKRIETVLAKFGLKYKTGGSIVGGNLAAPSHGLRDILATRQIPSIEAEFDRAYQQISTDPAAAVTAACAILEAFCKIYIDDESLALPPVPTLVPLWKTVSSHLGIAPAPSMEADINKILVGLRSIVDGIACLRTHEGTAHGHGQKRYRLEARHARLAVHAAHTLTLFGLETWDARKS